MPLLAVPYRPSLDRAPDPVEPQHPRRPDGVPEIAFCPSASRASTNRLGCRPGARAGVRMPPSAWCRWHAASSPRRPDGVPEIAFARASRASTDRLGCPAPAPAPAFGCRHRRGADGMRHPPLADQMAFLKSHLPRRKSRFNPNPSCGHGSGRHLRARAGVGYTRVFPGNAWPTTSA